jgi:hypothetical protein
MIQLARAAAAHLPPEVKVRLRRWLTGRTNPYLRAATDIGCVLDLYLWIADGEIDSLVRLENYLSAFFPDLDTATTATIELYGRDGEALGRHTEAVPHLAAPALRVSDLLERIRPGLAGRPEAYGNLLWYLAPPERVLAEVRSTGDPLLFWDRGYIGYVGRQGQTSFVHGVDKAVVMLSDGRRLPWPMPPETYVATPELPVEFSDYEAIELILQNRAPDGRRMELTVADASGGSRSWQADVPSFGVHRSRLDRAAVAGLDSAAPFRVRVSGLPTRYGRPIVLKRFPSGAFSLMHC